ncbi:hypothetical protein BS78_06G172700 [Paspalum vaginatum]|nr:hypothetical protein BS78_06G172700 [Paspalum vaginatum]
MCPVSTTYPFHNARACLSDQDRGELGVRVAAYLGRVYKITVVQHNHRFRSRSSSANQIKGAHTRQYTMQRWTRNGMLNFSQPSSSSPFGFYDAGQGASSSRGRSHGCRSQDKEQRNLEKNLTKVRKEWMKVKEEMGYARLLSEHLCETVTEADRKVAAMLEELDRTDKYMQDILSQQK